MKLFHYTVQDYWTPEEKDYAFPTEEERDRALKRELDELEADGYTIKRKDGGYGVYMGGIIECDIYTYEDSIKVLHKEE